MRTITAIVLAIGLAACGPPPPGYRPPTVVNVFVDAPAPSYERMTVPAAPRMR